MQRAIIVTLTLGFAWALVSHFKVLCQSFLMLWARHCQASYPVQRQVLLNWIPLLGFYANSVDPVQVPQNAAFDLSLQCFPTEISI